MFTYYSKICQVFSKKEVNKLKNWILFNYYALASSSWKDFWDTLLNYANLGKVNGSTQPLQPIIGDQVMIKKYTRD